MKKNFRIIKSQDPHIGLDIELLQIYLNFGKICPLDYMIELNFIKLITNGNQEDYILSLFFPFFKYPRTRIFFVTSSNAP